MSNHTAVSRAKSWITGAIGATLSSACVLIGDPTGQVDDAQCVLDYDECIGLGVGAEICQAIHDECAGTEDGGGQTSGPEPTGGCWDEVQHCLEDSNGDEQACADLIQQCEGGEGDDGPPGDDGGQSCWDEVEQCYETNADQQECEALAQMCGGADAGDDGPAIDPCQQALQQCIEMGGDEQECYDAIPECNCPPDDPQCNGGPTDCDVEFQQCLDSGQSQDECQANFQQCAGGPDPSGEPPQPDYVCDDILEHCYQNQDLAEICEGISQRCFDGESNECLNGFFDCAQVDPGQEQWDAPADCYAQLHACLG